MEIIVSARHGQLSAAMKTEAEDRLQPITQSYEKLTRAEVIFDATNRNHVEVIIKGKGLHIDGKAEGDNLYESLATAIDRVERQLEKKVDKMRDHSGKHLGEIEAERSAAILELEEV